MLLFTPPFDKTAHDPGYIKGYPPGLRENGGQYTPRGHVGRSRLRQAGRRRQARSSCLPCSIRSTTRAPPTDAERYSVEPYVVAADIYSVTPHVGRGGWTWYTGSAGWMYQAGLEGILGLRRQGDRLVVDPCIPSTWPGLSLVVTVGSSFYAISVTRGRGPGAAGCLLDGASIDWSEGRRYVPLDGKTHTLSINLAGTMN